MADANVVPFSHILLYSNYVPPFTAVLLLRDKSFLAVTFIVDHSTDRYMLKLSLFSVFLESSWQHDSREPLGV